MRVVCLDLATRDTLWVSTETNFEYPVGCALRYSTRRGVQSDIYVLQTCGEPMGLQLCDPHL